MIIFGSFFVGSLIILLVLMSAMGVFSTKNVDIVNIPDIEEPTTTSSVVDLPQKEPVEPHVVNILAFGLNDGLADTIALISLNTKTDSISVLSIPRDTMFELEGHNEPWEKKVNSIYTYKENGGELGMKKNISKLLGVPIKHYVKVEFSSVISIVDMLGGYDVYVPYDMEYDDIYDNPPLKIRIKQGQRNLNGVETVKFLRFRKNNDRTINEGDIVRMERQQHFIKQMMQKTLDGKILQILTTMIKGNYISTDVSLDEMVLYSSKAAKVDSSELNIVRLPGESKYINELSYWIMDKEETDKVLKEFYKEKE